MSRHSCSKVSPQALDRPFALAAQRIPVTSRRKTSHTNHMTAFNKRKRKRVNIYFLSWRKKLKSHNLRELTPVSCLKNSETLRYGDLAARTVSSSGLIVLSSYQSMCTLYRLHWRRGGSRQVVLNAHGEHIRAPCFVLPRAGTWKLPWSLAVHELLCLPAGKK